RLFKIACGLLVVAGLGAVFVVIGPSHRSSSPEPWVDGALMGLGPWPSRKCLTEAMGGEVPFFVCLLFVSGLLMRCSSLFRCAGGLLVLAALVVAVAHGGNTPGFIISCSAVYGFICLLAWRTKGRGRRHSGRWGWSLLAVAVLAAAFLYRSRWPSSLQWE